MPDGDVIPGLRRLYRLPYQELIEGKATDEQCIRSLLDALKRDLKWKGDIPIKLAQDMWKKLSSVINSFGQINAAQYAKLSLEFDRLVQYSDGVTHLKELVLRAGKIVLLNLKYDAKINYGPHIIIQQYMIEIFEKEFNQSLTLLQLSRAISEFIGKEFKISNPFLFSTKAEMCQILSPLSRARTDHERSPSSA